MGTVYFEMRQYDVSPDTNNEKVKEDNLVSLCCRFDVRIRGSFETDC